jgi:MFS family permease
VTSLRTVFAGRRGRLLVGLLAAEFGSAVQGVAYATVLPLTARELDGTDLYGATLAAGSLVTILVLSTGSGLTGRLSPQRMLLLGTVLHTLGVLIVATAGSMEVVLAGTVVRGIAAGLLASFGLTAVGALFEDALRARVLGLFGVVWLLPSLLGPVLNAALTVAFGWRWAMAWPALVVVVARLLVGRYAADVPWQQDDKRVDMRNGPMVVAGLVAASVAPVVGGWWGVALLLAGGAVAVTFSARILRPAARHEAHRLRTTGSLFGLCLAYFGGNALIALVVVEALDLGVVASSVAVGASFTAWSLTGLRLTGGSLTAAARGSAVVFASLVVLFALAVANAWGLLGRSTLFVVMVVVWTVAGFGMGVGYAVLSARAFDDLSPEQAAPVATGVAFAELAGSALGALLVGVYALAVAAGETPGEAAAWSWPLMVIAGGATAAILHLWRPNRPVTPA